MNRRLAIALLFAGTVGMQTTNLPAQNAGAAKGEAQPARIASGDLKKKLESGEKFLLIDVREDYELKEDGAIAGAIHIPVAELDARMKDIPKNVEIVFY
jgi:hypothetical protein